MPKDEQAGLGATVEDRVRHIQRSFKVLAEACRTSAEFARGEGREDDAKVCDGEAKAYDRAAGWLNLVP